MMILIIAALVIFPNFTAFSQEGVEVSTVINLESNNLTKNQEPAIYAFEALPNGTVSYSGNLNQGTVLEDLSWAWSSQNACFPETQKLKFTGSHVLYTGVIPAYSEMIITLTPDNEADNFSLYAYEIGANSNDFVPNLPRCIRCEADHKWDRPKKGKTQDHSRIVRDILALANPYRVVIGIAGANGLTEGGFTLQIEMKTR